jgi:hypothetical protein
LVRLSSYRDLSGMTPEIDGGNPLVATSFLLLLLSSITWQKFSLHVEYPQQKYFYFYDSFPCSQNVNFIMSILKLEQTNVHIIKLLITLVSYLLSSRRQTSRCIPRSLSSVISLYLRANQKLISSIGVLPYDSVMYYYLLEV